jgi:hypothetical protein
MSFSDRLRIETKNCHLIVDKHPFVSLIKSNSKAGYLYMQFNKICVLELQKHKFGSDLFDKFKYDISEKDIDLSLKSKLNLFLERCNKYYLEHFYMIQLGLLFGGNMLKKILPEDEKYFFDTLNLSDKERIQLIQEFKTYLDNSITTESEQLTFIKNVNDSYLIIKDIFDNFLLLLN